MALAILQDTPVKKATYAYGCSIGFWNGVWGDNPAAYAFAAQHFDLIVLECGAIWDFNSAFLQSMKTQNPNMKILGYKILTGTYPSGDDWVEINKHEDWFIHDINGNRIQDPSTGWYLMDCGSAGWRQFYVNYVNNKLTLLPICDGVFADNVWSGLGSWLPFYSRLKPEDIARYPNDMIGMLRYIKANLLPNKLIIINCDQWAEHSFLDEVDGKTSEGFAHATWENPNENPSFFVQMLDYFNRDAATGRYILALAGTAIPAGTTTADIAKVVKFCYAAYLCALAGGGNMHFCFNAWDSLDGSHGYYPITDMDIGQAIAMYYSSQNVLMRDFTGGKVLLNPSANIRTVNLDRNYRLPDGTTVTSVTLQAWSGEILTLPPHTLVINSTPITGVPVTIDGVQYTTPTSPIELVDGLHVIVAPANVSVGTDIFNFKQWEDLSTNPTRMFNLTDNATIIATYQLQAPSVTLSLIITSGIGGITNPTPNRYDYVKGESAIVTALPDIAASYRFSHWELDGTIRTENPIPIIMNMDYALRAVFEYVPPPPVTATIQGHIKDAETGNPIPGATVTCDGYADITEIDGAYVFIGIPAAPYTLTVSMTGYEPASVGVDVSAGGTFSLELSLQLAAPAPPTPLPATLIGGSLLGLIAILEGV